MKDNKTKYSFTNINDLMQEVLKKNKLEQGVNQIEVKTIWRKVMGEGVWTYTTDVKLINGNLTVSLRSSAIREELSYRKKDIIEMLNDALKKELIKKIRLL